MAAAPPRRAESAESVLGLAVLTTGFDPGLVEALPLPAVAVAVAAGVAAALSDVSLIEGSLGRVTARHMGDAVADAAPASVRA